MRSVSSGRSGIAVIGQCVGGDGDRHCCASSIGSATLGGIRKRFQSSGASPDPGPDLGVGLVGGFGVGIVVVGDAPSIRWRFGNAVVLANDVVPKAAALGASGSMAPTPTIAIAIRQNS